MSTYVVYPTQDQEQALESFLIKNNVPFFKDDQEDFAISKTSEAPKREGWEQAFKETAKNGDDVPD